MRRIILLSIPQPVYNVAPGAWYDLDLDLEFEDDECNTVPALMALYGTAKLPVLVVEGEAVS